MLEEEWKENFRMSKSTFFKLSTLFKPSGTGGGGYSQKN